MTFGWGDLDCANDVHAFSDVAECGESLSIRISFSPKIEFLLVSDANEEVILSCVWLHSCHGNGSVCVP